MKTSDKLIRDLWCLIQNNKVTAVCFLFSTVSFSIIEKMPKRVVYSNKMSYS